ncbi:type II secretion system F family protein [Gammaproteobacteria bacterium]|nr:type II secretion system F family protein [Gammaproteobacteria bacterium]
MPDQSPSFIDRYRARRELPELTRQISDLLDVGERLDHALETVSRLTTSVWLRQVVLKVRSDVQGGDKLSDALAGHPELFAEYYTAVVAIGESRGNLAEALRRISDQLVRQQRFADALKTALSYPLLVLCVTGVSLILILVYVLPQFHELFEDAGTELPWFAKSVLGMGGALRTYGLFIALAVAAIFFVWRSRLKQPDALYRWH